MANANPYYVQPAAAPLQGLQFIGERLEKRRDYQRALAKENEAKQLRTEAYSVLKSGTPEELEAFMGKSAEAQKAAESIMASQDAVSTRNIVNASKEILLEDAEPIETLTSYARKTMSEGGDAKSIIETARDVAAARTHEEKQAKIDRMREKAEMSWMVADPKGYKEYREQKKGDISSDLKVGSQEILEDGTIIQSTSKGPVVYNPQGEKVAGQAAADAVAVARAQKVSNARKAAGEKKRAVLESELDLKAKVEAGVIGAKDAAKISTKAFDRLEGINQNIANLDEGIRLLKKEGANTGVVDKYLPSFKKATIRLNNLQGQLGLDVLRNTTFGALSASELAFALDTAVPKGLQPLELAAWFEEKKASQEKLADYVESAAIYLGTPGNTVAGWIKKKRDEENKKPPKYKEGQTANGGKLIFKGGAWRDNT